MSQNGDKIEDIKRINNYKNDFPNTRPAIHSDITRLEADRPIFMIGMGRSGSTIMSEAFSVHDDLGWFSVYLNKVNFFPWITIFDRLVNIPKIGFHLRGKKKQDKGIVSTIRRYLPRIAEPYPILERICGEKISYDYLIKQIATEDERIGVTNLVKTILRLQGKKRLFTKFTGPPRIHYLNSIFPHAHYVHVIRDPRAVVASFLHVDFWARKGGLERPYWRNGLPREYLEEWYKSDKSPAGLVAIQWKRMVELCWEEKNLIPEDKYIEIKYEDFVVSPHECISSIFNKLGLSDCSKVHRYLSSVGKLRSMNYKFKQAMNEKDVALVEKITQDTAYDAGYCFER